MINCRNDLNIKAVVESEVYVAVGIYLAHKQGTGRIK